MNIKTRLLRLEKQLADNHDMIIRVCYKDGSKREIQGSEGITAVLADRGQIDCIENAGSGEGYGEFIGMLNAVVCIKEVAEKNGGEIDELQI